jgi:DNA primase
MRSLVNDVKEKLDVVDIVSGYVKLTPAGANMRGLCPFHREKTPSFMVSREKQIFHCFGCGKGGDVITFVEEMEGMDFREALRLLSERAGLDYRKYQGAYSSVEPSNNKEILRRVLEATAVFYENALKATEGEKARKYLKERKLKDNYIQSFRLGYAPKLGNNKNASPLYDHLKSLGFSSEAIQSSGSVYKKNGYDIHVDRFRGRIIFPIGDSLGRVVGFSARLLPGELSHQGKYINTPGTILYDKSGLLYGFHQAKNSIREKQEVVILEGNLDVIASHQAGVSQAVATCGTAVGAKQLNYLRRFTNKLIIAFDADMAGVKATKRTAELAWGEDFDVKIIPLKPGKDAADIASVKPKQWKKMVQKPESVAGYFFNLAFKDRILSLDQKKILADKILKLLAGIPSRVEQSHYLKKLAELVKVPENFFWEKISRKGVDQGIKQNTERKNSIVLPKGRRILLEERLIGLIYNYPRLYSKNKERLESLVFSHDLAKAIWREMKNHYNSSLSERKGAENSGEIKFTNREMGLRAKEYAVNIENDWGEDPDDNWENSQKELMECVNQLELERFKEKRAELLSKIKKTLPSQKKKLRVVMKEIEQISKEINRKRDNK